jgi:hypothetical protein
MIEKIIKLTWIQKEWLKLMEKHKGERFNIRKNRWEKLAAFSDPERKGG